MAARYVSTFNNNHSNLARLDNNFKDSLRSKLFRASFVQETKFVEGKIKKDEGGAGRG